MRLNPEVSEHYEFSRKVGDAYVGHLESFYRLPDFLEPSPRAEQPTDRLCVLVILYDHEKPKTAMAHCYMRMALWCRHSWLVNSDALDYDVDVKIYIEDTMLERERAFLESQHIDIERDVLTFSVDPIPKELRTKEYQSGEWGLWGRKMVSFWDEQLAHYDRIVCCDADAVVARPQAHGNLRVFERLDELQESVIAYIKAGWSSDGGAWHNLLQRFVSDRAQGYSLKDVCELTDVNLRDLPDNFVWPKAHVWTYPPSFFHKFEPEIVHWIYKAGVLFGHDECVAALMNELGIALVEFMTDIGIESFTTNKLGGIQHACIAHGRPDNSLGGLDRKLDDAGREALRQTARERELLWHQRMGVQ